MAPRKKGVCPTHPTPQPIGPYSGWSHTVFLPIQPGDGDDDDADGHVDDGERERERERESAIQNDNIIIIKG